MEAYRVDLTSTSSSFPSSYFLQGPLVAFFKLITNQLCVGHEGVSAKHHEPRGGAVVYLPADPADQNKVKITN